MYVNFVTNCRQTYKIQHKIQLGTLRATQPMTISGISPILGQMMESATQMWSSCVSLSRFTRIVEEHLRKVEIRRTPALIQMPRPQQQRQIKGWIPKWTSDEKWCHSYHSIKWALNLTLSLLHLHFLGSYKTVYPNPVPILFNPPGNTWKMTFICSLVSAVNWYFLVCQTVYGSPCPSVQ